MKALVTTGLPNFEVQELPVPSIEEDQVLVEVHAVALNPTDWKHAKLLSPPDAILGNDFAGVISKSTSASFSVGDRVAGYVDGSRHYRKGAFADYVAVDAGDCWKIPATTTFEEAAAVGGVGVCTAAQAVYLRLRIPQVGSQNDLTGKPFLVWAGSTSVGMYAVQLAVASGMRVVTTCSPKNFDLLKSLGAEAVFDYRDSDTPSKIKEWAGSEGVKLGLECYATNDSVDLAVSCFSDEGGELILIGPKQEGNKATNVKKTLIVLLTCVGKDIDLVGIHFPKDMKDTTEMRDFITTIPRLIGQGKLKANPLLKRDGGLDSIKDGFKFMEEGKNSGEKLVYTLKQAAPKDKPIPAGVKIDPSKWGFFA